MSKRRKHLATRWHLSPSSGGGSILRCYCGAWESDPKATTYVQREAHRAHRVEMGETVAPSRLSVSERLKAAEAALAEATAKLAHLTDVGHLTDAEIDLANRRLRLIQREMNEQSERAEKAEAAIAEQREVIEDQRRVNGEAISRAEKAEDAISRVRHLADDWATLPGGTYARAGKQVLAALDSPDVAL